MSQSALRIARKCLEREASYSTLRRLLIFIPNYFHVSAAFMKVISSDRRSKQFILSYPNSDNGAQSYLNELHVCSTYAVFHCVYSIKLELFYSKAICLLLRQLTLLD
jgi:hypothetical protein